MGLGDLVERALSIVGITPEAVEHWLGRPCGCEERKQKLNSIRFWSKHVITDNKPLSFQYLQSIMGSGETNSSNSASSHRGS